MLLTIDIVKKAARRLLLLATVSEIEDRDTNQRLPDAYEDNPEGFVNYLLTVEGEKIMFIMGRVVGAVSAGWKNDVGLVFHHAGLLDDEDDAALALHRLLASCFGHGIGLADDHDAAFQKAKAVLDRYNGNHPMQYTPAHFDQHESLTNPIISGYLVEKKIKDNYEDGECPDCGDPIPDTAVAGDNCTNCEHVFSANKPTDD